ncbi:equilibrative nucleoside transporter 1-like [Tropilaelaps mercedesae]|uniref:Equilibrative nucleoside transporter 1-like n=1 Tax=Tropilaelaps mercedesae TaxID=418985 RepID=A0A1V9XKB1_9ACAR|nr:equilibrative nucleoside transporter 1-like [Tropilaelaps mercedesae]
MIFVVAVATLTGSATGLCGFLPAAMMATISIGQSVGGIICALAVVICLRLGLEAQETALIYFLLSLVVLLITFVNWKAMEYSNPERSQVLLRLCVIRTALVPLLMLCNISPHNCGSLPVIFYSDTVFIRVMAISGVSNGYLLNVSVVNAPKTTSPENQELAGGLAACSMALGATYGSAISYFLMILLETDPSTYSQRS